MPFIVYDVNCSNSLYVRMQIANSQKSQLSSANTMYTDLLCSITSSQDIKHNISVVTYNLHRLRKKTIHLAAAINDTAGQCSVSTTSRL